MVGVIERTSPNGRVMFRFIEFERLGFRLMLLNLGEHSIDIVVLVVIAEMNAVRVRRRECLVGRMLFGGDFGRDAKDDHEKGDHEDLTGGGEGDIFLSIEIMRRRH